MDSISFIRCANNYLDFYKQSAALLKRGFILTAPDKEIPVTDQASFCAYTVNKTNYPQAQTETIIFYKPSFFAQQWESLLRSAQLYTLISGATTLGAYALALFSKSRLIIVIATVVTIASAILTGIFYRLINEPKEMFEKISKIKDPINVDTMGSEVCNLRTQFFTKRWQEWKKIAEQPHGIDPNLLVTSEEKNNRFIEWMKELVKKPFDRELFRKDSLLTHEIWVGSNANGNEIIEQIGEYFFHSSRTYIKNLEHLKNNLKITFKDDPVMINDIEAISSSMEAQGFEIFSTETLSPYIGKIVKELNAYLNEIPSTSLDLTSPRFDELLMPLFYEAEAWLVQGICSKNFNAKDELLKIPRENPLFKTENDSARWQKNLNLIKPDTAFTSVG